MKACIRIKIMQETSKCKGITLVDRDLTKKDSYRLRNARNKLNDKIEFYKKLCEKLEVKK
jgi:hypothetical protein